MNKESVVPTSKACSYTLCSYAYHAFALFVYTAAAILPQSLNWVVYKTHQHNLWQKIVYTRYKQRGADVSCACSTWPLKGT